MTVHQHPEVIRTFGHLPEPYDDLDTEVYGNRQLQRTKSRTYKIAAWSAIVGGHDFFLGRYARGTGKTLYLFAALLCFSLPYNNALGVVLTSGAVAGHFLSVRSVAHMSEDAPVFQSVTPASVLNVIYFLFVSPFWGVDYWSSKENRKKQRRGLFR
ncbi:hypothetical protein [Corynebacterium glyciniphilum]|uniref:hypothetical protein n=1 Tax=Corynebacterium glyciniphilum TaxID=1404244 RepID=UPI0011AB7CF0|nr:hypothetical protein [Corynebacterium glyciniphilum]